ncbi:pentatricopeptide repeat-containing protein At3g03580-like, partial [Carica papaya]|uniref:pentatricopeptide repeat-containing protein At3g03580-like n=1 Tax=Carica papaya TaxID=3649 RepID=UPI000B8D1926
NCKALQFKWTRSRSNLSSISNALSSASISKDVHKIHALIIASGLDQSSFFSGKLISKYAQLKDPTSSLSVFHRVSPTTNVYQWNSIIRALTQNGLYSTALDFYTRMQRMELVPDKFTFPSVINACAGLLDYGMGKFVHEHISKMGFQTDLYIGNALVDMYARFGYLGKARRVFEEMPQRDNVSWNSLISGYSSNRYWEEALEIYHWSILVGQVPDFFTVSSVLPACGGLVAVKEGEVVHGLAMKIGINEDVVVGNGLLSMYFKFDRLMDARRIFYEMVVRDTVSWNTVICGLIQFNLFEESTKFFIEMMNRFTPDLLTITSVIRACGHLRDLELGKFAHDLMVRIGYGCDITAGNILIDMYGKCG